MTDPVPGNPIPSGSPAQGVIQRAKDILLKPKQTWDVIAGETESVQSLYVPYVLILAAIGPVAGLIGGQVFGYRFLNVSFHSPLGGAIVSALLSYALTIAAVSVFALVIDSLATTFCGLKNSIQARKFAQVGSAWVR